MKVKIKKIHAGAVTPRYGTPGSACFDLCATHPVWIAGGDTAVVRTGLIFEVPEGHVLLLFSRSGHGFKYGLRLGNCVGVIDSDYRGEVQIKLRNDGQTALSFHEGAALAQGMVVPIPLVEFEVTRDLPPTVRGTGGFGSTDQQGE